jgi:hypothetical protein
VLVDEPPATATKPLLAMAVEVVGSLATVVSPANCHSNSPCERSSRNRSPIDGVWESVTTRPTCPVPSLATDNALLPPRGTIVTSMSGMELRTISVVRMEESIACTRRKPPSAGASTTSPVA